MGRLLITTLMCLLFSGSVFAEVVVLLLPRAAAVGSLRVRDLARVDALDRVRGAVENIEVPEKLYQDGYLDRREIGELIRAHVKDLVLIYGNAVKISAKEGNAARGKKAGSSSKHPVIKSGEQVNIVVRKNGISVLLTGTALGSGKVGETLSVRLKDAKKLNGIVREDKTVQVQL